MAVYRGTTPLKAYRGGNLINIYVGDKLVENNTLWFIEHGEGLLDLAVTGATGLLWTFPDGTTSTATRPQKTVPAGVTRCYASNWPASGVQISSNGVAQTAYHGDIKDLPRVTSYLNIGNCTQVTGALADLPRVTRDLNIGNCTKVTGALADLPRVTRDLTLNNCPQVTGALADLPRVTSLLSMWGCTRVTGSLADLPRVTSLLSLWGCTRVTGSLADLPRVTSYLNIGDCTHVTGALSPSPTLKTISLQNTGMTVADTDQTLINLASVTTVTSGGILRIKHNRTSASDAAVASLTGKFAITEG